MPTNFTVVPVEDAKGGSNSTAAAGGGRPVTLGKLFEAEEDDDNSQGPHSGSVRQNIFFLACRHTHTLKEILFQYPCILLWGHE